MIPNVIRIHLELSGRGVMDTIVFLQSTMLPLNVIVSSFINYTALHEKSISLAPE